MPPSGLPDPASVQRPWTQTYPPGVPFDYHLPEVALPRFLDDAVRDFPHREALVAEGGSVDHVTVRDRVTELVEVLRASGVGRGDRVLVGCAGGAGPFVVWFAVWRLAAIVVPVPHDAHESWLRAVVADVGAVVAVGPRRFVRTVTDAPEGPQTAIEVDDDAWLLPRRRGRIRRLVAAVRRDRTSPGHLAGRLRLERTLGSVAPQEAEASGRAPAAPDDLALITYGGSTTADPWTPLAAAERVQGRGLAWTHASLVAASFQARLWIPDVQAGSERLLVAASSAGPSGPTVVALGPLLGSLAAASVAAVGELEDAELARAVERYAPTLLVLPAARLGALLTHDAAKHDLSSLRVVFAIGPALDPALAAEVGRRTGGARVRGCVGADGAALTHAQPVYGRSAPGAMGLPVTGTVAAVVDPERSERLCRPGRAGRLVVHGPQLARPVPGSPDDGRFAGGWLITDQLVTMDADGVFHHLGTLGEVVERGGTWISPQRVEEVLLQHPAVRRAGVVVGAAPGTLLAAVVCTRRGRPTGDELLVHCRAHLDSPAVPDEVTLLDELPETEAGELARAGLRALLIGR